MRIGYNPNKDKLLPKSDYNHQVIIPVYIPNQEGYFKDSFQILQYCLESLFKTSHSKTYFTIVNNGSCLEIINYLNQLKVDNKIHEVIHTTAIGKLNAILKGLSGHQFPLITITDADVLFLKNWQKATYDIFENFPKAGAICAAPSSKVLKQSSSNLIVSNLFSPKLKFTEVLNPNAMQMFAESIGSPEFYSKTHLEKYLTLSNKNLKAVVGAGHFMTTYRGEAFNHLKSRFSAFALGGKSETMLLDEPINDLGYWRLSTTDNFVYHLGNVIENWMLPKFEEIKKSNTLEENFKLQDVKKTRKSWIYANKIIFSILSRKPIWKLFLKHKGLTKEEANKY
jgi:hypothetical protein